MVRAKACLLTCNSQRSGSTVRGTAGRVGNAGQATCGGWLPQERALWVRRYCRYSERASPFISATYSWKDIVFPCKPLIGTDLMCPPGCQISNCFSAALTQHVTRLSRQFSAHVVVLAVNRELTTSPDGPRKGLLIDLQ